jgi:hypothetical protein
MQPINLAEKLELITEHWRPKVVAEREASVLLFEPAATRNTGNVEHPTLTAPLGARIKDRG